MIDLLLTLCLGWPDFGTRQRASWCLEQRGLAALPALLAAEQHADPEIAWRVAKLLEPIRFELLPPPKEPCEE